MNTTTTARAGNRPASNRKESRQMTITELEAERTRIEAEMMQVCEDIASIKGQIEHAQARRVETGIWTNPMWFAKANSALRRKNAEREARQCELGKVNRRIKELKAKAFDARFIDVARRVLTKEQYIAILSQVAD
jgi:ribosomal protein L29